MARSLNKQILLGNVGSDPVVRTFESGGKKASLSLATSTTWVDKVSGERKERTEWHRLVFRDQLADVVERYVVKGSEIYVEGPIRHRRFKSQDKEKSISEILVRELTLMGGGAGAPGGQAYEAKPGMQPSARAERDAARDPILPDDVDLGMDESALPF